MKNDGFYSNLANFNGFCLNLVTIWCFFAQISWVLQKSSNNLIFFCLDLVIFAQVQRRSGKKYRSSSKRITGSIIVSFDWSDYWSNNFDLTSRIGFCGRRRVFSPKTRCHWISCGLGTNPTRTDLWTLLTMFGSFLFLALLSLRLCLIFFLLE